MALCRNDTGVGGKMNDFEATASFLLPNDPVSKKRSTTTNRGKQNHADISSAVEMKSGTEKTNVPLIFHTKSQYNKLTSEQKMELKEYRAKLISAKV